MGLCLLMIVLVVAFVAAYVYMPDAADSQHYTPWDMNVGDDDTHVGFDYGVDYAADL